ncbi:hypothetical protein MCOR29_008042 [Pyricularia oryzae]|uniref:Heterokaryon incompatibility domain-containing protein n=1 Tax=Pyricularia grisea TaxID=148305 RepID=A0ABQ8N4W6_PYRGI|nr:hypothetical protein MCOR19_003119 [Pyricularia oryzae]KAI6290965.1 hypothetical protein MCOR33_010929 [Pyricularia grisea]KAI6312313.1 hypothetical protein MCOR29_008042 [Pyricularia oryzae]KAI6566607.1 hypothetical protein MCOR03_001363 [Pyricularia oryzae]
MFCSFCEELSIERLVELTAVEYRGGRFPDDAFYQHHATIEDLVDSADGGCEFCQFIVACAEATPCTRNLDEDLSFLEFCQECEMRSTDVKIAIHAHHTDKDQTIGEVKLLDTVQIWLGPNPPYDYQEMEEYCHLEWPLNLNIRVPRERPLIVGNHRIGRNQLDPDLGSDANFAVARSWFDACCNEHNGCPPRTMNELPTRLVDVGEAPDWNVRLAETQGGRGEYVALSHCWGMGSMKLTLRQDNLKPFLETIPVAELPANFRDAITITRKLGMRYIWIDSLCIIQGDHRDWGIESGRMTELYLNAAFTICAAASEGSDCGILHQPQSTHRRVPKSFQATPRGQMRVFSDSNSNAETVALSLHKPPMIGEDQDYAWGGDETMSEVEIWGALSRRAWTLQEKILSPRRLVYGKQQIYWICVEGCQPSDGLPECLLTAEDYEYPSVMRHFHSPGLQDPAALSPKEIRQIQSDYYSIVSTMYTARKLTKPFDKLPAFAGLAKRFQPIFGGTYLAGVWSHDIHRGITWYNCDGPWPHALPQTYRAPSWSWACVDKGISTLLSCNNSDRVCHCVKYSRLELLDYTVEYCDNSNPYGQIRSASLSVRGRTRSLRRFRPSHSQVDYNEDSGIVSVMSWFDDSNIMPSEFQTADVDGQKLLLWPLDEELSAEQLGWCCYPSVPEKDFVILVVEGSHGCFPRNHREGLFDNASVTSVCQTGGEEHEAAAIASVSTEENFEQMSRVSTYEEVSSGMDSPRSESSSLKSWMDSQNGSFWTDVQEELADSGLEFTEHNGEDVAGSQTDGGGGQEEDEVRIECLILERDLDREDIAYIKVGLVSIFEPIRFLEDWEVNTLTLV